MNDSELIQYCRIHADNPRPLFSKEQVNRMIALAGYPAGMPNKIEMEWLQMKESMQRLCSLALQRQLRQAQKNEKVVSLSSYRRSGQ